jgi:TolB protein
MNADGSDPRNLTNNSTNDYWAELSPDGSQIIFVSGQYPTQELYVMEADGSNITQLTYNFETAAGARWRP